MEETPMQINELKDNEINIVLDYYFNHKKEFKGLCLFEDFVEQYCRRCDICNRVICILDMCEECDIEKEYDKDFEYFDRNKEYYVYRKEEI